MSVNLIRVAPSKFLPAGRIMAEPIAQHAIGTMVLGVMTRVSLGHSARALRADRITVLIYLLVVLAAMMRVVAAIGGSFLTLIQVSALLWIAAFSCSLFGRGA
jgi:uncharacterized protein involved in response to NO